MISIRSQDYKDTVLRQMNDSVNVMLVDWSPLSKSPNYLLPAASVREIGHSVAEMAIDFQLDAKRIVCVGHSLGAHVCGGFGEKMNENKHSISQIWGNYLDFERSSYLLFDFDFV